MRVPRSFAAALLLAAVVAGCARPAPAVIAIRVTDDGFVPATTVVPKGRPYTLAVTRVSDATCATEMVFTRSGRKVPLPLNETVSVPMPASNADTIGFTCGMGMYGARLVAR